MSVAGPGAELLAVDLGTQSLRLAAYDSAGRRRWTWSAPVDSHIEGDVFEQSPEQWESLLLQGLGEAQRAGVRPVALAAAGPEYVAPMYAYLASDFSADVTGQIFIAAGGFVGRFDRPTPSLLGWRDHRDAPPWSLSDISTMLAKAKS